MILEEKKIQDVELNTEARPGACDVGLVDSCKPADSCNIGDSCKPDDSLSPMTIIPAGRQIPRTPPQILETKPSTPSSSRQTTPLDGQFILFIFMIKLFAHMNIYISYRTLRCPWKTNLKKIWKINFEKKKLFEEKLRFF